MHRDIFLQFMNRFSTFTRNQRIGIVFLLLLIVVVQILYFFVDFTDEKSKFKNEHFFGLSQQLDSLRKIALEPQKDTIYPFNPNFITDYKGFTLGMTPDEIDRLLAFRKENKFVNSAKEFQQVTQISDSLLAKIAPSFKFPDWVNNSKTRDYKSREVKNVSKSVIKHDINQASKDDLMKIYGIGNAFSERIIKYREKLQGFTYISQVSEVYGLEKEVFERIAQQFEVKTPPTIQKRDINRLNVYELSRTPYLNFEDAKKIVALRSELGDIKNFDELLKISGFDTNRIEMLQIYLLITP